jgi:hypothetical protein
MPKLRRMKSEIPEPIVPAFRSAVKAWMDAHGGIQALVAKSGVARSTINNWFLRESAPTLDAAARVARVIRFTRIR